MGVSKNRGFSPQIIPCLIGFSIIFTIHFQGKPPIFGSTPKKRALVYNPCLGRRVTKCLLFWDPQWRSDVVDHGWVVVFQENQVIERDFGSEILKFFF